MHRVSVGVIVTQSPLFRSLIDNSIPRTESRNDLIIPSKLYPYLSERFCNHLHREGVSTSDTKSLSGDNQVRVPRQYMDIESRTPKGCGVGGFLISGPGRLTSTDEPVGFMEPQDIRPLRPRVMSSRSTKLVVYFRTLSPVS